MNEKKSLTEIFKDLFKDDKTPVTQEFVDGYDTIYKTLKAFDIIKTKAHKINGVNMRQFALLLEKLEPEEVLLFKEVFK